MVIERRSVKATATRKSAPSQKSATNRPSLLQRIYNRWIGEDTPRRAPQSPYRGALVPHSNSNTYARTIPFDRSETRATMGRCDIACRPEWQKNISRRHFELAFDDVSSDVAYIRDVSKYGTYLNGESISSGMHVPLRDGCTISVVDPASDNYVKYTYRQPYAPGNEH